MRHVKLDAHRHVHPVWIMPMRKEARSVFRRWWWHGGTHTLLVHVSESGGGFDRARSYLRMIDSARPYAIDRRSNHVHRSISETAPRLYITRH